jgi:hypothetical protein
MEVIIWADHVRSEEVLRTVKEDKNIVHTTKTMKVSWIVLMLHRNCLLKHINVF